jgi:hypothetical protein
MHIKETNMVTIKKMNKIYVFDGKVKDELWCYENATFEHMIFKHHCFKNFEKQKKEYKLLQFGNMN